MNSLHGLASQFLDISWGEVYQFKALCFDLSTAPQDFIRVSAMVSEWTHQQGIWLLCYRDNWLVIVEWILFLLQTESNSVGTWGTVISWEKSDPEPSSKVQYLGGAARHYPREFLLDSPWIVRFCDLVDKFLLLPSMPAKMWQQLLGHMGSLEWFAPGGRVRMHPLQWQLKAHWSAASRHSSDVSSPVLEVHHLVTSEPTLCFSS